MRTLHSWHLDLQEATATQAALRQRIVLTWDQREIDTVAGLDVHFTAERARAAIVVMRHPGLELVEQVVACAAVEFPYIPGFLAFREGPALVGAWQRLECTPDLLMFDGHGIAHPCGLGVASHMGLWFGRPSIGVAKARLVGRYMEPGRRRGEYSELVDEAGKVIGAVLRTREGVRPVFVSPGHLIDLDQARRFVMDCCTRHRLPEPTRRAHMLASEGG